ncbi:MAG: cyclic nucleotide-binding domain-containing protein [Deltaproteobacteria bacterium]|nr:cyclic nucleotide-binding domain-containing protein [Deltaproteobacteria bacterium]
MSTMKPAAAGTANKVEERSFTQGKVIFNAGDTGGDLFFIDEGEVEIYTVKDGQEVRLSTMRPGEIIGVMTCLTDGPRMASARTLTATRCRVIPHASVMKTVETLPPWLKIVLKEYGARLDQMNSSFASQSLRVRELQDNQLSHLYYAQLMVSAIANMSEFIAITQEAGKVVVIADLLQRLEMVLNLERPLIDRIYGVLLDSGLIRVEIEPERKRQVIKLQAAQKMTHFVQFVRETKHGAAKKYLKAKFNYKETRLLSALVKFAARQNMPLDQACTLPYDLLKENLQKAIGVPFEEALLAKPATLQLVSLKTNPEAVEIRPQSVSRTVACIEAVLKLKELDDPSAKKKSDAA